MKDVIVLSSMIHVRHSMVMEAKGHKFNGNNHIRLFFDNNHTLE